MQNITLTVGGMTCGGCAKSVERALAAVDGVEKVAVNLEAGSAQVTFDAARADAQKLIAAVEDAGFDAAA